MLTRVFYRNLFRAKMRAIKTGAKLPKEEREREKGKRERQRQTGGERELRSVTSFDQRLFATFPVSGAVSFAAIEFSDRPLHW